MSADAAIRWNADGLLCAIAQDARTGTVLMQAWVNAESLQLTRDTGKATFWSRSRQSLWTKGESSGHYLHVRELRLDCDGDCLLMLVEPVGPACHTGARDCFISRDQDSDWVAAEPVPSTELARLEATIRSRRGRPAEQSYVASLFARGREKILQKVGEEAVETVLAAAAGDAKRLTSESADLLFHLFVALAEQNVPFEDVLAELARRSGTSGLVEKASRKES
ncbi:MAG: bifunctional phosphoribosyl-AMP cyclohydrolase/phosphoribosyl-ATP diphosphatase HisIE [Oceanococcaceae bacterium]